MRRDIGVFWMIWCLMLIVTTGCSSALTIHVTIVPVTNSQATELAETGDLPIACIGNEGISEDIVIAVNELRFWKTNGGLQNYDAAYLQYLREALGNEVVNTWLPDRDLTSGYLAECIVISFSTISDDLGIAQVAIASASADPAFTKLLYIPIYHDLTGWRATVAGFIRTLTFDNDLELAIQQGSQSVDGAFSIATRNVSLHWEGVELFADRLRFDVSLTNASPFCVLLLADDVRIIVNDTYLLAVPNVTTFDVGGGPRTFSIDVMLTSDQLWSLGMLDGWEAASLEISSFRFNDRDACNPVSPPNSPTRWQYERKPS